MRFTKLHQWVDEVEPGIFRIGLSSFAIKELGEVVYIDFLNWNYFNNSSLSDDYMPSKHILSVVHKKLK